MKLYGHMWMAHVTESLAARKPAADPLDPGLLERIPHFTSVFTTPELRRVISQLADDDGRCFISRRSFPPGHRLIQGGSYGRTIFWILQGQAEVQRTLEEGNPVVIKRLGPGECFGDLAAIGSGVRAADVVAGREDLDVLCLEWAVVDISHEIRLLFYEFILKSLVTNLGQSYETLNSTLSNALQRIEKLSGESARLRKENTDLRKRLTLLDTALKNS